MRIRYAAYGKRTWADGPIWSSVLYDKTVSLSATGLKVNKFPHPSSYLSDNCVYNIVTGQCHRFLRVDSSQNVFLQSATDLYTKCIDKGYQRSKLDQQFALFIRLHSSELHMKHNAVSISHDSITGRKASYKGEHSSLHNSVSFKCTKSPDHGLCCP